MKKIQITDELKEALKDPKQVKKMIKAMEEICDILGIDISDIKKKPHQYIAPKLKNKPIEFIKPGYTDKM